MQLASRFASRSPSLRSDYPLSDDQIRRVAPSIFADAPHESRSERYSYIPTAAVLTELRKEGFQPFMVTQTRVRDEGKREHTKHMLRLRHANQINGAEANEIVLLNSHDGTSSYQMLAGMFRFVCSNDRVIIAGRDSAQDSINQVGQEMTRRNMNIQPTLTGRPGLPVRIIVNRDLMLRPYQPLFVQRGAAK